MFGLCKKLKEMGWIGFRLGIQLLINCGNIIAFKPLILITQAFTNKTICYLCQAFY